MREDEGDERDCGRLPKAQFASVRPLSVRLAAVQLAHLDELPEGQTFDRKIEYAGFAALAEGRGESRRIFAGSHDCLFKDCPDLEYAVSESVKNLMSN
jgi:hypothetical protein